MPLFEKVVISPKFEQETYVYIWQTTLIMLDVTM